MIVQVSQRSGQVGWNKRERNIFMEFDNERLKSACFIETSEITPKESSTRQCLRRFKSCGSRSPACAGENALQVCALPPTCVLSCDSARVVKGVDSNEIELLKGGIA
jgi:hypothetical protein